MAGDAVRVAEEPAGVRWQERPAALFGARPRRSFVCEPRPQDDQGAPVDACDRPNPDGPNASARQVRLQHSPKHWRGSLRQLQGRKVRRGIPVGQLQAEFP